MFWFWAVINATPRGRSESPRFDLNTLPSRRHDSPWVQVWLHSWSNDRSVLILRIRGSRFSHFGFRKLADIPPGAFRSSGVLLRRPRSPRCLTLVPSATYWLIPTRRGISSYPNGAAQ